MPGFGSANSSPTPTSTPAIYIPCGIPIPESAPVIPTAGVCTLPFTYTHQPQEPLAATQWVPWSISSPSSISGVIAPRVTRPSVPPPQPSRERRNIFTPTTQEAMRKYLELLTPARRETHPTPAVVLPPSHPPPLTRPLWITLEGWERVPKVLQALLSYMDDDNGANSTPVALPQVPPRHVPHPSAPDSPQPAPAPLSAQPTPSTQPTLTMPPTTGGQRGFNPGKTLAAINRVLDEDWDSVCANTSDKDDGATEASFTLLSPR
jgi:hypothetical protein